MSLGGLAIAIGMLVDAAVVVVENIEAHSADKEPLNNAKKVMLVSVLVLIVTAALFPFIGKSFMPSLDEGDIIMQIEKLPSVNLDESTKLDMAIQKRILETVPDVLNVIARVGSDELGLDPMGLNETDTFLVLKPHEEWKSKSKEALIDQLRTVTAEFPGVNFSFTQPIEMRTSEMLSGKDVNLAL
eukprot:gene34283-biopygen4317